jgi:hypothetical protein
MRRIALLPSASHVTPEAVSTVLPGEVCACDFYVTGAESGVEVPGGYALGPILNIDHHAPTRRMARFVSSTNLAIDHVLAAGLPAGRVVVNHTDCDSVLSAGIAAGLLDPDPDYGRAAIAADHTGEEQPVADLLQALDRYRDLDRSFDNLRRLRAGLALDDVSRVAEAERRRKREAAATAVGAGLVRTAAGVAFGVLERPLDSEFFPALLPDAMVIVLASRSHSSTWTMKLRLGRAAPDGLVLHDLRINEFDQGYGGRWNAGSNARAGGTTMTPDVFAEHVRHRLREAVLRVLADASGTDDGG